MTDRLPELDHSFNLAVLEEIGEKLPSLPFIARARLSDALSEADERKIYYLQSALLATVVIDIKAPHYGEGEIATSIAERTKKDLTRQYTRLFNGDRAKAEELVEEEIAVFRATIDKVQKERDQPPPPAQRKLY